MADHQHEQRISELIVTIANALVTSSSSIAISESLQELEPLSLAHGLTTRQSHAVLRLAIGRGEKVASVLAGSLPASSQLDLAPNKTRVPTQTVGLALLRALRPSPGTRFGPTFVRDALGALGPDPGVLEFGGPRGPPPSERTKEVMYRPHVPVRVQAALITLLLRLRTVPPLVATIGSEHVTLPHSFYTNEARTALSDGYGVLFHYLDYATLRPSLIRLLGALTRKRHVRPYRVTKLLALQVRDAALAPPGGKDDPTPSWLLQIYARYYPDLVIAGLTRDDEPQTSMSALLAAGADAAAAAQTDPAWILEVMDIARRQVDPTVPVAVSGTRTTSKRKATDQAAPTPEEAEQEAQDTLARARKRRRIALLRRALTTRTTEGKVDLDLVDATAEAELETEAAAAEAAAAAGQGTTVRRGAPGRLGGLRGRPTAGPSSNGLGTLVGGAPGDRTGGLLSLLPSDTGAFGGDSRGALLTVIRGFRALGRRMDRLALPARVAVATAPAFTGSAPRSLTLAARLAVVATLLKPADAQERLGDALVSALNLARTECELRMQQGPGMIPDLARFIWTPALNTASGWADAAGDLPPLVVDYLEKLLAHVRSVAQVASADSWIGQNVDSKHESGAQQLEALVSQVPLPPVLSALVPHIGLTTSKTKLESITTSLQSLVQTSAAPRSWRIASVQALTGLVTAWVHNAPWPHWLGLEPDSNGAHALYGWVTIPGAPSTRVPALSTDQIQSLLHNIEVVAGALLVSSNALIVAYPQEVQVHETFNDAWQVLTQVAGIQPTVYLRPSAMIFNLFAPQVVSPSRIASTIDRMRRSFERWEAMQMTSGTGAATPARNSPYLTDLLLELPPFAARQAGTTLSSQVVQRIRDCYNDENRSSLNVLVVLLADCVWRLKGFASADPDLPSASLEVVGQAPGRSEDINEGVYFGLGRRFFDALNQAIDEHGLVPRTVGSVICGLAWFNLAEQSLFSMLPSDPSAPEARRLPVRSPLTPVALRVRGRASRPSGPSGDVTYNGPSWTEFRAKFLRWLDDRGAGGMYQLLSSIMSSLRQLHDETLSFQPPTQPSTQ